jgi:hypothetical protein
MNKKYILIALSLFANTSLFAQTSPIYTNGNNVGIGITNPTQQLQVKGQVLINQNIGTQSGLYIKSDAAPTHYNWKIATQERIDGGLEISRSTTPGATSFNQATIALLQNGNVGIGTSTPREKLTVSGNIQAKEIIASPTSWADKVFDPTYKLWKLSEVEQYILKNKHLPGIPTEKEAKKGLKIAETQAKLLQKIEELTLYIIALEKEVNELKQR